MIIDTKEELEAFLKVLYVHKIGLSTVKCSEKDIIYFHVMENGCARYVNVWE